MLIDCDGCAARGLACGDCVVTLLLGSRPILTQADGDGPGVGDGTMALDRADRRALHVLADAGLVPRLRHEPRSQTG